MAMKRFRAPRLPDPPPQYSAQHIRQLLRVLEIYFNQLDSQTPNTAESYTADEFIGGILRGTVPTYTTAEKNAFTADVGTIIYDSDLDALCFMAAGGWQTITAT